MVRQGNELKGGVPSTPPVFDQRHGVGMNKTLGAPSRTAEVFTAHERKAEWLMPLSARHKYLPEKVLVRSVKNE